MRSNTLLGLAAASGRLIARASDTTSSASYTGDGDRDVGSPCYPNDPAAPCRQISNIEEICMLRGISFADHQKCMCDGSYFSDWFGCQRCLRVNGIVAQDHINYWGEVMSSASSSFCGSEPTTYFHDVFAGVTGVEVPTAASTDSLWSLETLVTGTEISEYFTAEESQGPGITPTREVVTETTTEASGDGTTMTSSSETETETETGDGQGDDDEGAAAHAFDQGAPMAMAAGAALLAIL